MEKTTLYLPADLQRDLRDASRRMGRPQAELVREALRSYLRQHERPLPPLIGIGEDGELSGRDSEDWLRAEWDRRWDRR